MLADMFKKAKFSIKNLAGTYVLTALQTKLSAVVDSPVKSLTRSTTYTTKTVVSVETLPEPGFLICTTAGTTAAAEPDYATLAEGQEITDGTAKFKAYFYGNMIATMTGATSVLAGTKGIVPAPVAGDEGKYLKGNGLWEAILIASQAEAEAGTENTKTMTALRTIQALIAKIATTEQVQAGISNDTLVSPAGLRSGLNASGSAPVYGTRAWVNFNGTTTTPTINGSGNVSSITDRGTGKYTVNFTTNMPDDKYAILGSASVYTLGTDTTWGGVLIPVNPQTSSLSIVTAQNGDNSKNPTYADYPVISVGIVR